MRCYAVVFGLVAVASVSGAVPAAGATAPTVTISAVSGPVGTPVTITGTGFPPNVIVALYIDSPTPFIGTPGPRADAQGGFTDKITWPGTDYDTTGRINPAKPGPHQICGDTSYPGTTPAQPAQACAEFLVVGGPSPSPHPTPSPTPKPSNGPSVLLVLVVAAVLIGAAAGAVIWWRRSP